VAVIGESWAEPILTFLDNMTGGVFRVPVENFITNNSQYIGYTSTQFLRIMKSCVHTALGNCEELV
jgi:hypothetical protein